MSLPVRVFWFMNDQIPRIQSQEDQRQFQVINHAQGGEHTQEFLEGLNSQVGNVLVIDPVVNLEAERDTAGFEELRSMSNQLMG